MDLPTWINEQFFATVLKEKHKKISLRKFTAYPAAPPGSNYMSDVFRVKVEYENEEGEQQYVSLIVKAPNDTNLTTELEEKVNFFKKEPLLYAKLFPKINKKMSCEFGPTYYECPIENGLVLQDLSEHDYFMANRINQLDYSHCHKVFTTIAKFHASSIAVYQEDPELIKKCGKEILLTEGGPIDGDIKIGVNKSVLKVAKLTKDMEDCRRFHDLLLSRVDHIMENCVKTFTMREGKLNVLNHGDLWTTNILFKHDSSRAVKDVKFIDYQLTRYTSPVYDLVYFMWTSANDEVRERSQGALYDIYLKTLNTTLAQLGCEERLSPQDLQEDLKAAVDFALIVICHLLPTFVADPADGIIKIDEMNSGDEQLEESETSIRMFNGKYFKALLPTIARQFMFCFS